MPVTVKKILLWRKEVDNQAGALARTLEPLAKAGADHINDGLLVWELAGL